MVALDVALDESSSTDRRETTTIAAGNFWMDLTRRAMLTRLLGTAGLAAIATGVPASFLRIAGCKPQGTNRPPDYRYAPSTKAQFLVMAISRHGNPINANAPGSYDH